MNRPTLAVRAARLALDLVVGVLMIWVPYLAVVGLYRGTRWLVTTGIPHGLFYLGLGLLLAALGVYLAIKFLLTHGPDSLTAIAGTVRRTAASGWSRVGYPARLMIGGAAAMVTAAMVLFTLLAMAG